LQPILTVNLTSGAIDHYRVPHDWERDYIGAASLAARLLYADLTPHLDPLAPAAPLLFLNGPLTGRDFSQWSDRLRDVEEMLDERDLRDEAARIRDRARSIRAEFTRHGKEPQWDLVKQQITNPLTELRKHLSDKLAQLQSDEALVPIDRDPVPGRFAELVRKYYENLGGGD